MASSGPPSVELEFYVKLQTAVIVLDTLEPIDLVDEQRSAKEDLVRIPVLVLQDVAIGIGATTAEVGVVERADDRIRFNILVRVGELRFALLLACAEFRAERVTRVSELTSLFCVRCANTWNGQAPSCVSNWANTSVFLYSKR